MCNRSEHQTDIKDKKMQSQIQYTERIELGETLPKPMRPETQLEPRSTHIQAGGE